MIIDPDHSVGLPKGWNMWTTGTVWQSMNREGTVWGPMRKDPDDARADAFELGMDDLRAGQHERAEAIRAEGDARRAPLEKLLAQGQERLADGATTNSSQISSQLVDGKTEGEDHP